MTQAEIDTWESFIAAVIEHEDGHLDINLDTLSHSTTVTGYVEACESTSLEFACEQILTAQAQLWYQNEKTMNALQQAMYHDRVGTAISLPPGFDFK